MARTLTHKVVYRADGDTSELYDLSADPKELKNLWDSEEPSLVSAKKTLLGEMLQWYQETSDTTDWQVQTGRGAPKMGECKRSLEPFAYTSDKHIGETSITRPFFLRDGWLPGQPYGAQRHPRTRGQAPELCVLLSRYDRGRVMRRRVREPCDRDAFHGRVGKGGHALQAGARAAHAMRTLQTQQNPGARTKKKHRLHRARNNNH